MWPIDPFSIMVVRCLVALRSTRRAIPSMPPKTVLYFSIRVTACQSIQTVLYNLYMPDLTLQFAEMLRTEWIFNQFRHQSIKRKLNSLQFCVLDWIPLSKIFLDNIIIVETHRHALVQLVGQLQQTDGIHCVQSLKREIICIKIR